MGIIDEIRLNVSSDMAETFEGMNLTDDQVLELTRPDLLELFPSNENFLERKKLQKFIDNFNKENDQHKCSSPISAKPKRDNVPVTSLPPKVLSLPPSAANCLNTEAPSFVLYKSPELEQYVGAKEMIMNDDMKNRLVRCTIDNMISACNTLQVSRFPQRHELTQMAKLLVCNYPCLADKHPDNDKGIHLGFYSKLLRRLQNIQAPKRKQGSVPSRSKYFKSRNLSISNAENHIIENQDSHETVNEVPSDSAPLVALSVDERNQRAIEKELGKQNPNYETVHTLLNMTYYVRTQEITLSPPEERKSLVLTGKYKVFKKFPLEVIEEVARSNHHQWTRMECTGKLKKFLSALLLYGFSISVLKEMPTEMTTGSILRTILPNLQAMFDSKKKNKKDTNVINVLKVGESPEKFRKNKSDGPGLIVGHENHMILIGDSVFTQHESLEEATLIFLGLYFVMDMDYPDNYLTSFSILQNYLFGSVSGDTVFMNIIEKINKYM